ncbi:Shewanella-like protein phosphatase 2 [Porphyridium purpureum]|uniref:Shewanella-like protein phosphatase 2 n=1 Tax=Porphyridium purpureum TaxID=35688 RepID=A0A5J4Z723_PORPP|nr:Shewanella-like protein phosphatase 2 [Porphyridium purpureum]|eukprot:POR4529..scf295_1
MKIDSRAHGRRKHTCAIVRAPPASSSHALAFGSGAPELKLDVQWPRWLGDALGWLLQPAAALAKAVNDSDLGTTVGGLILSATGDVKTRFEAAERLVAIGDIHGDVDALRVALKLCNVLGPNDEWVGGKTVLVQVGDQLDRGDTELAVLRLLYRLQDTAPAAGGKVHILLGNHELMNVEHDFRYVTQGGFAEFAREVEKTGREPDLSKVPTPVIESIKAMPQWMRPRALAFRPGGTEATLMANRMQVAVVVGDNLFVHGGLKPEHVTEPDALETMNKNTRQFLLGKADKPTALRGGKSPVWMRNFSRPVPETSDCSMLTRTLQLTNTRRMIVGHTPQAAGVNGACSGRVWRVDTGMSSAYGGIPEALEITPKRVRILTPRGVQAGNSRMRR